MAMRQVYSTNDIHEAQLVKSALLADGIETLIKNEQTFGRVRAFGIVDHWPEIWILDESHAPTVIDADGLNVLAGIDKWWSLIEQSDVLTPHAGEMQRLLDKTSINSDELQRPELAHEVAKLLDNVGDLESSFCAEWMLWGLIGCEAMSSPRTKSKNGCLMFA